MIKHQVKLENHKVYSLVEIHHVSELKRIGVPLKGSTFAEGLESGSLTFYDRDDVRHYTWLSEPGKTSRKTLREWFSTQYRVLRYNSIGETWYEVQEWKWYWPFWDTWTNYVVATRTAEPIRYKDLYTAREAIVFYQRSFQPASAIVDRL